MDDVISLDGLHDLMEVFLFTCELQRFGGFQRAISTHSIARFGHVVSRPRENPRIDRRRPLYSTTGVYEAHDAV